MDLRPGFLLTKSFLIYGRVGVAFNELSIEQEGMIHLQDNANGGVHKDNIEIFSSEEKDVSALRLGLGTEYKFTHNLAINVDYVFTDYGSIDTELSLHDPVSPGDSFDTFVNTTAKADVTKHTLTAGLNWYFGGRKPKPAYHGLDK